MGFNEISEWINNFIDSLSISRKTDKKLLDLYTFKKKGGYYVRFASFSSEPEFYIDKNNNIKPATIENLTKDFKNNNLYDSLMEHIKKSGGVKAYYYGTDALGKIKYKNDPLNSTSLLINNPLTNKPDIVIIKASLNSTFSAYTKFNGFYDRKLTDFIKERGNTYKYYGVIHKNEYVGNCTKTLINNSEFNYIIRDNTGPGETKMLLKPNSYIKLSNLSPEQIRWRNQYYPNCTKSPYSGSFNVRTFGIHDLKVPSLLTKYMQDDEMFRYVYVFDFETTGLNPEINEILELGICIYKLSCSGIKFQKICEYNALRKVEVSKEISKITGITQEIVDSEAIDDEIIINDLKNMFDKYNHHNIFASYNLYFDASFYIAFCNKNSINIDFEWLDILTIAKDRFDYPHKLSDVINKYRWERTIENTFRLDKDRKLYEVNEKRCLELSTATNSHRAKDDANAAALILKFMMEDFDDIIKYIGIIGHPPKYRFKKNPYICQYISNGQKENNIHTRVQFYKREYPIYINEKRDEDLYLHQNPYQNDEIIDDFSNLDFELIQK